jgi:DNA/RNA endonuclease G (NUC1)
MSNIVPQVPKLNQRTWKFLEDYCKKLCVKNKSKLQCVAGVLGIKSTIARGFITVPEYFFKVVHVRTVDNLEQLICVIIPNDENVNLNWKTYECNLDTLQVLTGLNFSFSQ